jgi:hypothetical protein
MKQIIAKIVNAVLKGEDYRTYVLATINQRFLDELQKLIAEIFEYKKRGDNWLIQLMEDTYRKTGKESKFKLLWFGGLNEKTVKNMTGGTSCKEVCLEIGKKNLEAVRALMEALGEEGNWYQLRVIIKKGNSSMELDALETVLFLNIISAMRLTIQGGAWSEVGKQTEKVLLWTIFHLLEVPEQNYILVAEEMKRKGLVENREIDAIVFSKEGKPLTIEVKLLGIGNPEIGDEALARKVDLFLIDRLTDMMIQECQRIGIKVVELRQKTALSEVHAFLDSKNVPCSPPPQITTEDLEGKINEIVEAWEEEAENLKVIKKLKKWTS